MSIKVGIVGSGIVGQTLANGFVKHGYDVMIGTNTASKREELKSKTNGKTKIGTFEDVLATKGTAVEAALKVAGIDQFGFDVADMGAVEGARAIEPLCILWCIPAFLSNSCTHAFKLLKK